MLFALAACRRAAPEPDGDGAIADAAPLAPATSTSVAPATPSPTPSATAGSPGAVDETCEAHDDCVALTLFLEGDLRCCLSCGATAAVAKRWADRFGAWCAATRAMSDCPIADCDAKSLDARCVGRRCVLVARP